MGMRSINPMRIPAPCTHDPIRLTHAMTVFGSPGTLPAEFKCSTCGVRWFVDEPSPWPDVTAYTTGAIDAIGTQMGIVAPDDEAPDSGAL